jgi:acyl-CoA hydrolase
MIAAVDAKPAADSVSVLVRWMGIGDANSAGFVHGGVVMKMCDEAAGIASIRHCGRRVVTAGMDRMAFILPVHIGELLTCSATVNAAWRTSMEVGVRVEAENPLSAERHHTSSAYLTMVALDDRGEPTEVPPLVAESETERRRQREAEVRRRNRLAEREEILEASRLNHKYGTSLTRRNRGFAPLLRVRSLVEPAHRTPSRSRGLYAEHTGR